MATTGTLAGLSPFEQQKAIDKLHTATVCCVCVCVCLLVWVLRGHAHYAYFEQLKAIDAMQPLYVVFV